MYYGRFHAIERLLQQLQIARLTEFLAGAVDPRLFQALAQFESFSN